MESVIVVSRKVIKISDLLSGRESSCAIPDGATEIVIFASKDDRLIEIEFVKDGYIDG